MAARREAAMREAEAKAAAGSPGQPAVPKGNQEDTYNVPPAPTKEVV